MTDVDVQQIRGFLGDYLRQRGFSLRRHFRCLNPEHEDRHPSMCYNSKNDTVHCFACGVTYDLMDLIGMDYGLTFFPDQYRKACGLFGIGGQGLEYRKVTPIEVEQVDCSVELESLRSVSNGDLSYLNQRGITKETCQQYGLFQLDGQVYFPIEESGLITGWCSRTIFEHVEPRYRNSNGRLGLWNGDLLGRDGKGSWICVTEGILDALCLEQLGMASIALCGSQNTRKFLQRCEQDYQTASTWRFVLCGDNDDAGRKMNRTLADEMSKLGLRHRILMLPKGYADVADLYLYSPLNLSELLEKSEDISISEYANTSVGAALPLFFEEILRRETTECITTGFPGLDKLLDGGLYPGLYVIGAISSLGKTSFLLQLADWVASEGVDVLLYSLEQSKFELMAKSMSRISAQLDSAERRNAFSCRMLLSNSVMECNLNFLKKVKDTYADFSSRLFIREGISDIGVEDIRRAVQEHKEQRGVAPVLMVDYLQILKPFDSRATDKQSIDRAVVELKRLSRDYEIPVIAISSFNRDNYRMPVSMESYKESGAVEYSADVLFGMQLVGVGQRDFDVNRSKLAEPRQLEFVMLKNRNGIPYAKLNLRYWSKFGLFEQV